MKILEFIWEMVGRNCFNQGTEDIISIPIVKEYLIIDIITIIIAVIGIILLWTIREKSWQFKDEIEYYGYNKAVEIMKSKGRELYKTPTGEYIAFHTFITAIILFAMIGALLIPIFMGVIYSICLIGITLYYISNIKSTNLEIYEQYKRIVKLFKPKKKKVKEKSVVEVYKNNLLKLLNN